MKKHFFSVRYTKASTRRILPPNLRKAFQQARISSANFFSMKLARKSSILCGESMCSKVSRKDLKGNSFQWFRVKLEFEVSNCSFVS